ncbi:hypothetical protein [Caloranaerobacter sp. DY30410]|uniref:hypothetical protein n=1 Tax=Caloranaerobacter sp. DY30410 TaxID=3238305 RepID=UPI003D000A7C
MGKIASMILSVLLILGLIVSMFSTKVETIDELLAPYKMAIDRINAELMSSTYILDKNKEKVFNNIKDMSPNEIKKLLHEEYRTPTFLGSSHKTPSDSNNHTKDNANNTIDTSINAKYRYGDYIRENAMGKESEPKLLPNFSGPIHVMLLQ